jgi:hypothetical protein
MFRFTIRDMLWLMVVVALAVALWREWGSYERAYLEGAAADDAVWRHEYKRLREDMAKEAERVRKRYNIPYPALPADPD